MDKLLELVRQMRTAQKGYFKEKDPIKKRELLIKSKELESSVDQLLAYLSS